MRRRKRSFRNSWIAIRASPDGATTRCASRGVVPGRGSHRPEEQPDAGVGANRQPAGGTQGLGFASAYVFGAVCPSEGKAAALIMPICNTLAMNHHLCEISSQVAAPRFREGRLCPCRGDLGSCWLAPQPRTGGAGQYHVVGAAAVQPGAQSGRADLALSTQPLARQLGVSQPGGYYGCQRDGLEQVCQQPPSGPLALRRRLGSGSARF